MENALVRLAIAVVALVVIVWALSELFARI